MNNTYKVVDEFVVQGVKVIALDKKIAFDDLKKAGYNVKANGKTYPYGLTHNEFWLIVKTDDTLLGENLIFV